MEEQEDFDIIELQPEEAQETIEEEEKEPVEPHFVEVSGPDPIYSSDGMGWMEGSFKINEDNEDDEENEGTEIAIKKALEFLSSERGLSINSDVLNDPLLYASPSGSLGFDGTILRYRFPVSDVVKSSSKIKITKIAISSGDKIDKEFKLFMSNFKDNGKDICWANNEIRAQIEDSGHFSEVEKKKIRKMIQKALREKYNVCLDYFREF